MTRAERWEKGRETAKRRSKLIVRVFELKLQPKRKMKRKLKCLFLEAKWFYNWIVADLPSSLQEARYGKARKVPVKVKEEFEERELIFLSSQMRQGLIDQVKEALKSLSKAKSQGRKVGKLKFKKYKRSIPLKQYGSTFAFTNEARTRVRLQKIGRVRVLGGKNIPSGVEIGRSWLLQRTSGYYLLLVCFLSKEQAESISKHKEKFPYPVSLDFGIKEQLTTSTGIKVKVQIEETEKLKRLQSLYNRIKQGIINTPRRRRTLQILRQRIEREHEKIARRRKEIHNQILGVLKRYKKIGIQDDNIKGWHEGWFGRQVQHSALGRLKERIKNGIKNGNRSLPGVKVLDRWVATTRTCYKCGKEVEVPLSERVFRCPFCGWTTERDHNSALVISKELGLDRPEGHSPMPGEVWVWQRALGRLPFVRLAFVRESHPL